MPRTLSLSVTEDPISSPVISRKPQLDNVVETAPAQKTSGDLWFIHGKYYDLTPFISSHPGGTTVLEMAKGLEDATPLMESYHAFANRPYIYKMMSKYEVKNYVPADAETRTTTDTKYTFAPDGFYMTLTRRVREHFGASQEAESVTNRIKTNAWWNFKVALLSTVFCASFLAAFLAGNNRPYSVVSAAIAGSTLIMVGFTAMHDASHYALGARDSWKNKVVLRAWNALALWGAAKWLYHHTVRHHSFTGDPKLDPDVIHARPLVRKHLEEDPRDYVRLAPTQTFAKSDLYSYIVTGVYAFVLNYAQVFAYNILWPVRGTMWGLDLDRTLDVFDKFWWEYALSAGMIGAHAVKADWVCSLAFFSAASICYGMCILADHDTFESAVENHVGGGEKDWGEIQVRHSSDFATQGVFGKVFGEVFGSINSQIGHHLFPSVNHVFLPELVPIITQVCEEFDIPYASHNSLLGALLSVSKMVKATNEDALEKVKEW